MAIKALVYGGVQIGGICQAISTSYDGVYITLKGTTLTADGWKPAGCTIEMNPQEALDLAGELIRASSAHSLQTAKQVAALTHRLAKKDTGKRHDT